MKKSLLFTLMLIIPTLLFAGPFGMEFGWTLDELENSGAYTWMPDKQGSITSYNVNPTNPHSLLSYYIAFIDDTYGLVSIRVASDECYSEYQIRNIYDRLKTQLSSAYGKPEEFDEISWTSDWDGSENFIRSILYGDRVLASIWNLEPAENKAKYVLLGVLPVDEYTAYVSIEYYSSDFEQAFENYNASEVSVL